MQKKLIALAVAGLASAGAFAQSNVTVYGVADAYVGSFKTSDMERQTKVNSGGLGASRIGFKGVEDLGNGLKALFVLEYRLDIDQNTGIGSGSGVSGPARQQMVGLTGGFGTAVAGRLQTAGYDWALKSDVLAGTAISPLQNVNAGVANSFLIGATAAAARADNAIAYISPSFGGVTVALNRAYLAEETGASPDNKNTIANLIGVSYDNGPLFVGAVYADDKNTDQATPANEFKLRDWSLGAGYDFKVAKLTASYQQSKLTVAGDSATNKAFSLGVAVPVSAAGTVLASYAQSKLATVDDTDNKIKSWTLAYTHALSKRTTAYAGYNQVNRDDAVAAELETGAKTTGFVAGVNHKF